MRWAAPISRLRSAHPEDRAARPPEEVREIIARVRRNGFAERSPDVQPRSVNTFSVPIRHGGKVLATLGVSYFISAMPKTKAIASYVPPLLDMAMRIEASVADLAEEFSERLSVLKELGASKRKMTKVR